MAKSYFVPSGIVPVGVLAAYLQKARNELFLDPARNLRLNPCSKIMYSLIFEKSPREF